MTALPASYEKYLQGRDLTFYETVRPVLLQSTADQLHGVRIVFHPGDVQAHLDDRIPYGEIVEDVD